MRNIHQGDQVRFSAAKGQFEKGYLPSWSREEFIVDKVNKKFLPNMVSLKDNSDEEIEGGLYADEIQKILRTKMMMITKLKRLFVKRRKMDKFGIL